VDEKFRHAAQQEIAGIRFGQVIIRAGLEAGENAQRAGKGRQQNDGNMIPFGVFLDGLAKFIATHARHVYVGDDQVDLVLFQGLERFVPAAGDNGLVTAVPKNVPQRQRFCWAVFSHQDALASFIRSYAHRKIR
jgi:hypothetical protein